MPMLSVITEKPSQPKITGPASADSGGRVTLTCSSSSRSLPPDHPPLTMTYIWRRNSEKIQEGKDVHVAGPNLIMRHISKAEDGNYSCQAVEEGLESDWSHGHDLDVQYGPEQILFNGTTSTVTAAAGAPLTVRCSADCNPACTVTWWNTSRHRLVTGHREAVLSTPAVDRSGQYICHVYNTHGNKSRNLKLDKPNGVVSMSSLLVLVVVVVVVVVLVVCGIRGCRRLRAKRKLRYAAHLTALNNRASSESPYATVHDEGARVSYSNMSEQHNATANDEGASLPLPRSDDTADYVSLGQEEHVHIYTALRPKVRQQVGGGRRKADTAGGSPQAGITPPHHCILNSHRACPM
ncbi:cell adhesion molecule 4-like isoform X2 [Haliotis rubra]|uniref:cell adhesion molecule 4-like isoform X2 n=1 Tax=Haliotis rubra TaxID=36100 RepID=UPI001EE5E1DC|nr:cell adhesion molecule 4-like isoform X2 [Haliotis rubra]